jgi:hypothetical protein
LWGISAAFFAVEAARRSTGPIRDRFCHDFDCLPTRACALPELYDALKASCIVAVVVDHHHGNRIRRRAASASNRVTVRQPGFPMTRRLL